MGKRSTLLALLLCGALLWLAAPAAATHDAGGARTLALDGKRCDLIPVPTAHPTAGPFGFGRCPGVRPGALVETRLGFCTMNFLFRDRDGRRYVGTAGHCVLASRGERRWNGAGPVAKDAGGRPIGRFHYAALGGERDFALIELSRRARREAQPGVCHFGGPTGTDATLPGRPLALEHYGQGIVTGGVTPARTLTANGMRDRDHVFAQGTVLPGDSGGPVTRRSSGRGVGLVVTTGLHFDRGGPGTVGITRLAPQLARAAAFTGERLQLLRASRR